MEITEADTHPVQRPKRSGKSRAPVAVTMAAYEVYSSIYRPQKALITGDCRGGFSTGELIALLYARSFPRAEWRARFREALTGAENL